MSKCRDIMADHNWDFELRGLQVKLRGSGEGIECSSSEVSSISNVAYPSIEEENLSATRPAQFSALDITEYRHNNPGLPCIFKTV